MRRKKKKKRRRIQVMNRVRQFLALETIQFECFFFINDCPSRAYMVRLALFVVDCAMFMHRLMTRIHIRYYRTRYKIKHLLGMED